MRCTMIFEEPVSKIAGHRVLALNRGEKRKNPHGEDQRSRRGDFKMVEASGD